MHVLRAIPDPEMPISIVDLGLINDVRVEAANGSAKVAIEVLPTFVGCPALEMIAREITEKVGGLEGVDETDVRFVLDPPWTVDRISEEGRAALRTHGVTVPEAGSRPPSAIECPFCGSDRTTLESVFGPTRCRSIYYCNACRNSFERMKRV